MGEKSEMSSMSSVQSAWEDLVVENPNRRKLEVCLLTTLMIVVICIIALVIFVVVNLQPAENLIYVSPRPYTTYCHNGSCPAFSRRLLGWVHWGERPCDNFHKWACFGRQNEAPEVGAWQHDSGKSGEYQANERFRNVLIRHFMQTPMLSNAEGTMYQLFQTCVEGFKPNMTVGKLLKQKLMNPQAGGVVTGFIEDAVAAKVTTPYLVHLAKMFNFYPYGRMEVRKQEVNLFLPSFLASKDVFKLKGFAREYINAFSSLSTTYRIGLPDNGGNVLQFEAKLVEVISDSLVNELPIAKKAGVQGLSGGAAAPILNVAKMVEDIFGLKSVASVKLRHPMIDSVYRVMRESGKSNIANLATFKLFLHLSLFMDEEKEPSLKPFITFAKRYYWSSSDKQPLTREYRCGTFLENYMAPAMMEVVKKYEDAMIKVAVDRMKMTTTRAIDKVLTNKYVKKSSVFIEPQDSGAMEKLLAEIPMKTEWVFPSNMAAMAQKYSTLAKFDEKDPFASLEACSKIIIDMELDPKMTWRGGFLKATPTYDPDQDLIFIPYGFLHMPYYHLETSIIAHAYPIYGWKYNAAILKRVVFVGYEGTNYKRLVKGIANFGPKAVSKITKSLECFRKMVKGVSPRNATGGVELFFDTSAVSMTYRTFRDGLNHDKDKNYHYRLEAMPFLNEETLFYASLAQANCEYVDPKIKAVTERGGPTEEMKINVPVSSAGQRFFQRVMQCHPKRAMVTMSTCSHLLAEITLEEELTYGNKRY